MDKIIHLCLANFYIDNYSYQENILPKEHKKLGYDVTIIASTETFADNMQLTYVEPKSYVNEYGINVIRIPYLKIAPTFIMRKIRAYKGLKRLLNTIQPNIIFVHDVQFFDALIVKNYVLKAANVKVYVDCHADFSNSARTFISREILHKIYYKFCAKCLENITIKFWGVLPSRVKFLKNVYNISKEKIDLLLMGAEDEYLDFKKDKKFREIYRKKYSIASHKKIIVTGGKIDSYKKDTLKLMEVAKKYQNDIELIIFGSISNEIVEDFNNIINESSNIKYEGWLSIADTYGLLAAADFAIFPGRHSVLWEQCVALGVPIIVKYWPDLEHLDIGGNLILLAHGDSDELNAVISRCIYTKELEKMNEFAGNDKRYKFSYSRIAAQSIEHDC